MKTRIFNPFVYAIGMIALLLLQGCDNGIESLSEPGTVGTTVKQVDMTVIVPIHPSSLEYFDYCISYADNNGMEYRDTVRTSSSDNIYWRSNFSYKSLPVVCRCETILIPKVPMGDVASFSYIIPKPYIFSHVIFNSHSYDPNVRSEIEELEVVKIDNMEIGTFMSVYGSFFVSTCIIKEEYGSISCSSH